MSEDQKIGLFVGAAVILAILVIMACIIAYNVGRKDTHDLIGNLKDRTAEANGEVSRLRAELEAVKDRHHRQWCSIGYQEDWLMEPREKA
jgi:hypothetical protein